jgi:FkbM family methyltransferase
MLKIARRLAAKIFNYKTRSIDRYLRSCSGVIHIGANCGQERYFYARHRLPVVWIEPLTETFETLTKNISGLVNQLAIKALITDRDGDRHTLHVANNDGQSSSIFDFHLHRDIWPDIHYLRDIEVVSSTLPTALKEAGIDAEPYDALVLDTQGSELLILRGAAPLLPQFKFIKTEAADFESYKGGCTMSEICSFLGNNNFSLRRKELFAQHPAGGRYFDLLFKRN